MGNCKDNRDHKEDWSGSKSSGGCMGFGPGGTWQDHEQ